MKIEITLIWFKFKIAINKNTDEIIVVLTNILKHGFGSKSLRQHLKVFYDLETMFEKLDETELKLEE